MISNERRRKERRFIDRRRANRGLILVERRKFNVDRRQSDRRTKNRLLFTKLPEYNLLLDKKYLFQKIEIRDPYFSLEDVTFVNPYSVRAKTPAQQTLGMEVGPMVGAEAGRHLAILGVCALSMLNESKGKYYYLAYSAELERVKINVDHCNPGDLMGVAHGRIHDNRIGVSQSELYTPLGETVYKMSTQYLILSERLFLKRYGVKKVDLRKGPRDAPLPNQEQLQTLTMKRQNPYSDSFKINIEYIDSNKLKASLGIIKPEHCRGHFPQVPALPKAIFMNALSNCAGELLKIHFRNKPIRYCVKRASVRSDNLGFAGESINLEVSCVEVRSKDFLFYCEGFASANKKLGDMWLTLSVLS